MPEERGVAVIRKGSTESAIAPAGSAGYARTEGGRSDRLADFLERRAIHGRVMAAEIDRAPGSCRRFAQITLLGEHVRQIVPGRRLPRMERDRGAERRLGPGQLPGSVARVAEANQRGETVGPASQRRRIGGRGRLVPPGLLEASCRM